MMERLPFKFGGKVKRSIELLVTYYKIYNITILLRVDATTGAEIRYLIMVNNEY